VYIDGNAHIQVRAIDGGADQFDKVSTASFRDYSSWYHFVIEMDTTQSTAEDRVKVYANGERITSWSGNIIASQNANTPVNNTNAHNIGRLTTGALYLDGYLAEVNFIDGQALDPTSFGEFKSGVWIPKSYSGSYGTNGFYLDFATRATDPIDASGNGNNWGSVNVVSTDWMPDSPTNNFCTLNPLYEPLLTYSEGNLRGYYGGSYVGTEPTMYTGKNQKYYSEELIVARGGDRGISVTNEDGSESIGWIYNGNTYGTLAAGYVMPSYTTGDIIGYATDGTTNQVQFYKNGVAAGSAWQFSTAKPLSFKTYKGYLYGGSDFVANFGQDSSFAGIKTAQGNTDANGIGDFYYAPPAGYLALCTANLPDPAIDPAQDDVPADYFNTVLWTGDGASSRSITGVGFQPDFIWTKNRSTPYSGATSSHYLNDVVRGSGTAGLKTLVTNSTGAETDGNSLGSYGGATSLDTDGFTVESGTSGNYNRNASGVTYVAWNWLAGNGTSTNTDGTITSTVSANQKAGFSIVSYTGTGSSATVGHGLSDAPDMMIIKNRDNGSQGWHNYHVSLGATKYIRFDTAAAGTATSVFNDTEPTSSVFSVGTSPTTNGSADAMIAYCFHSVEGYSKIGSYTGNSASTNFIYTGFRPAFVMWKNSGLSGENWYMMDTARDPYNVCDGILFPNLSNAEASSNVLDFLSNGFALKVAGGDWVNKTGNTYIYMAFAEMPFKYSNAR
jgi:hypothetical protein